MGQSRCRFGELEENGEENKQGPRCDTSISIIYERSAQHEN